MRDGLETGDFFTFVGYPWRKTRVRPGVQETDLATYTGHASAPDVYDALEYNRHVHVLIRLRRKKTYSSRYESRQTAPHPQGISGGAVIAWPLTFSDRQDVSKLKLAAICHSYHAKHHCMAATRIVPILVSVLHNNPKLIEHFHGLPDLSPDIGKLLNERIRPANLRGLPVTVALAWYRPETYTKCLKLFDDAVDLPSSYNKWIRMAERVEGQLTAQGYKVLRAEIDPKKFQKWCKRNGFQKIDKHARIAFGNEIAKRDHRTNPQGGVAR